VFSVKSLKTIKVLLLAAAVAFCGRNANGYVIEDSGHWTFNRTVTMHLSLGGPAALQDGFRSFNESAADALNIWNGYLVHMQFASVLNSPLTPSDGDSDNSAFFSDTVYGDTFGNRVLAITLISSRDSAVIETDVIFNNAESWNSYRGPLQQSQDFHRVALHEFGHVVGLDHPDDAGQHVTAVMNSVISDLDSLAADDISGAQSIYNNGPAYLFGNPAPNLLNLSTRGLVGTGGNVLIGGFIIQGSQPATVILRAIGHSLAARGVSSPLTDPVIELRNAAGTLVAQNDDWVTDGNAQTIASYRLDPSNSRESALFQTLNPGNYTAVVRAFDNNDGDLTGTALFELFDLHITGGRLGNISTRGQVLTGNDVVIAGVVIGGSASKEVVIRGIGPSLSSSGIAGALSNPLIELHDSSGAIIATNDNWQSDESAARVQQAGLAPTQPVESALDRSLNPGSYTVILRGVNNATGVGLVEIYDVTPAP
jgi:Matrixin